VASVDLLLNPEVWVAFLTLLALEIVLGIDNIVFISILVDKLPEERQALARRLGLGLALVMRILLLLSLSWVIGLTAPLFTLLGQEISGRDVILILGGLFCSARLPTRSTRTSRARRGTPAPGSRRRSPASWSRSSSSTWSSR
jgi:predicted tellurium resistance membrane protein TerC